jgi:hypothetical protein
MPTTATKKKPATPAESLRELNSDIRAESAADWRRWAIALADGEGAPGGRELLAAAAALKIQDPANELQAAADAILEVRVMTRGLATCEKQLAEMLAPFDGDFQKLLQAVEVAKAEVERLQGIAYTVYNQANRGYYTSCIHQARRRHPHVWPDCNETIAEVL